MLMDMFRALFALAFTLGLFALGVYAVRRWGPKGMLQLARASERRLSVVETLSLDSTRRLVLVRCDGRERLILLGEGRVIDFAPGPEAAAPATVKEARATVKEESASGC